MFFFFQIVVYYVVNISNLRGKSKILIFSLLETIWTMLQCDEWIQRVDE